MMMNEMRYAIITNPASGNMTADMKLSILAEAAAILDSEIYGLDTNTAEDLSLCAQELINHCDVLVIAGGDGTLSISLMLSTPPGCQSLIFRWVPATRCGMLLITKGIWLIFQ